MFFKSFFTFYLYIQCLMSTASTSSCPSPLGQCSVLTTSGRLTGDCSNQNVKKFLSIPYAKAPVGSLRFADPKEYRKNAHNIIRTDSLPASCPQYGESNISEDCLFLNVYAPSSRGTKPVLFWVHGGSNIMGGSRDPIFEGTKFANNQNVIIVTFNYRLGLLGFYDDGSNTNFAVKDAIMALKWVRNNIAVFGGNPRKITVFGNSSGGSIIRAMLASPSVVGLINNVIFQSDPQDYGFNKRSVSNNIIGNLAREILNCKSIHCLRNKSLSDILAAQSQMVASGFGLAPSVNKAYMFGPNIDYNIVFKDYGVALKDGSLPTKVDTIMGFVDTEAGPTISTLASNPIGISYYPTYLSAFLGTARASRLIASDPAFSSISTENQSDAARDQLVYTGSALFWECPIQFNAGKILRSGNVFVYTMTKGIQYPTNAGVSLCAGGAVCHQDDLYLTFGTYSQASTELQDLSNQIQTRWANFAKHGNPNFQSALQWPKAQSSSQLNVLDLGGNKIISEGIKSIPCNNLHSALGYDFELYSR